MDTSGLRIGNSIDFEVRDLIGTQGVITAVHDNHVYINSLKVMADLLRPRHITEDRLIEAGFDKVENKIQPCGYELCIQIGNTCNLSFSDGDWWISYNHGSYKSERNFWNYPESMHQVQNLYYTLSGEELIKK